MTASNRNLKPQEIFDLLKTEELNETRLIDALNRYKPDKTQLIALLKSKINPNMHGFVNRVTFAEGLIFLTIRKTAKIESVTLFCYLMELGLDDLVKKIKSVKMEAVSDVFLHKRPKHLMNFISSSLLDATKVLEDLMKSTGVKDLPCYRQVLTLLLKKNARYDIEANGRFFDPTSWIAVLIYHEAILRGDFITLKDFRKNEANIQYQSHLISDLLFERPPITKTVFNTLVMKLTQLKGYDLLTKESIDDVLRQLEQVQPDYEYNFDYPQVLLEHREEVKKIQTRPLPLSAQVIEFYIQLGIYNQMKSLFFSATAQTDQSAKEQKQDDEIPDRTVTVTFDILKQTNESIKSLRAIVEPVGREFILASFDQQAENNPFFLQKGAIKTLCAIADHPELPQDLKIPLINLIDRMAGPEYRTIRECAEKKPEIKSKPLQPHPSALFTRRSEPKATVASIETPTLQ